MNFINYRHLLRVFIRAGFLITLISFTISSQSKSSTIRIGFLTVDRVNLSVSELNAAINFLKANSDFSTELIDFNQLLKDSDLLSGFDVIWIHRPDSSDFLSVEKNDKIVAALKNFVSNGGGLLLTLDALRYINLLGVEIEIPTVRYVKAIDEGYGRKLGLHSYRSHPIFSGLNGGAYIWAPAYDQISRQIGFFDESLPQNGKVAAVDWSYIHLKENSRLVIDYDLGKGKILAVGAYTIYDQKNFNRLHLELFTNNCIRYLAGIKFNEQTNFWTYHSPKVLEKKFSSQQIEISASETWSINRKPFNLHFRHASDNFFDVAGQRILVTGKEKAGIDEIWIHPFMALRDYEVGIRFSYKDTIYWLKDQTPRIEVNPESLIRTYKFPRAYITEFITPSVQEPLAVIHYEYRGVYPAEIVIRGKSNLRIMWPYSENVLGTIYYGWDEGLNAFRFNDERDNYHSIIGINKIVDQKTAGPFNTFVEVDSTFIGVDSTSSQASFLIMKKLKMNDNFDVIVSGSGESKEEAIESYKDAFSKPKKVFLKSFQYYDSLLANSLLITTPDSIFNEGYRWALIGTDKFYVNTPGIGSSLVAGYSTTEKGWDGGHRINGRPGYGWYFGRDGQWSGLAVTDYGDFEKVKNVLMMFSKYQDLNGKIFHELTTSGAVHYDASDATPLYIILAGHYLKNSGDIEFIRKIWNNIKRAVDFCFSTDTDGDHLIENTLVGHGWVEGGGLYTAHTELYLAGCWAKALEEAAYIAQILGFSEAAEIYKYESQLVTKIINTKFWNEENTFLNFSKLKDGSFNSEKTVLSAVPILFDLVDSAKSKLVIDHFAANDFSSDWGVRILSEESPIYNPRGYHTGSVWPLFTGWVSLAEYKYGNSLQGYFHLMSNLLIYKNWNKGYVEEVMHGEEYRPAGVCPHQCWSETMVLQPAIEGMIGVKVNALKKFLSLSPKLPANWDWIDVTNIRIGAHNSVSFSMQRNKSSIEYKFKNKGKDKIEISFNPELPPGTKIQSVMINNEQVKFITDENMNSTILKIDFELKSEASVQIYYTDGISILPLVCFPNPGSKSNGFRILNSAFMRNKYIVDLEGKSGSLETFSVYSPGTKIIDCTNAKIISVKNGIYTLETRFMNAGNKYERNTIVFSLTNLKTN
ncbi:MAG: DUF4960 domain-containing protein [Ignavibacteriaceae bacterium]|nr:DUF4960 domain-containing protein [Ignavibacteriaceae bacterium]